MTLVVRAPNQSAPIRLFVKNGEPWIEDSAFPGSSYYYARAAIDSNGVLHAAALRSDSVIDYLRNAGAGWTAIPVGPGGQADICVLPDDRIGIVYVRPSDAMVVLATGPSFTEPVAFGPGKPGCRGAHTLTGKGYSYVGNAQFAFRCSNAPFNAMGLCLVTDVSDPTGADPFELNIPLYVDLFLSSDIYVLDMVSGSSGLGLAPAPIPNVPALTGLTFYTQAIWAWAVSGNCLPPPFGVWNAPFGLSASHGLQITID